MERPEFNSRISSPMTILGSEDESDPVTPHASQNGLLRHPKWSKLKTVSLKVETTLYEVPEQLLSDSLYFGERISDDTDKGTRRIPIVLEDVKVFEMDALLCILDARVVDSEALTNLTYDHWAAILRLATLWRFSVVRSLAIDQISTRYAGRDPLERLELAMNCQVKQWVHPIFVQLCKRSDCLSSQEAERLGVLRFAAITRIREMILRSRIVDAIPTTSSALTIAQVPLAPAGGGLCSGCGGQLHKLWVHKAHDHPLVADTCGGPIIGGASPLAGKAINIAAQVEAAVELRVPF
ncbi:hypothetical protein FRB96_008892 [Tulasnella sp. 330]|nr:hypothetical protein FRB96_008892 [Tulasnella sp. 330]KAG8882457.1 hypothetical protein FRB98_003700 [Tulasnella sp. 332]